MLTRPILRAASTSATSAAINSGAGPSSGLSAYLLLSRPPTVLRSPTPLESAYHAYNSKIQHAISQPFPREVYFKKGSAAETKFLEEERTRRRTYLGNQSQGAESSSSTNSKQAQSAARAEESNEILYRTVSRRTEADELNQTDSLERSLDRHLFLLVKGGEMGSKWTLPFAKMDAKGSGTLHKAAPEAVYKLLGDELDIWMVTNLPVGVVSSSNDSARGYIMRGHILSGQPTASSEDVEFAWLTREEIKERMSEEQWKSIEDLLST